MLLTLSGNAFATTITYTYDSLNRVTKVDYGNGFTEDYTYDAAGNRLTLTVTATEAGLLGEMNGDDLIDISDVILVLRIALGLDPLKPCSDINNDGFIDISDVILTLRMALGLDSLKQCT
jgi:YD repeat-containing protein